MYREIVSVALVTLAFLLASVCFGTIIGDTTVSQPDNRVYHYQPLIAGVLAIVAAIIGGWFVLCSAKYPERVRKRRLIENWIRRCEDVIQILDGKYSLATKYQEIRTILLNIEPLGFIDIDADLGALSQEILDHYIENVPDLDVYELVVSKEKIKSFEAKLRKAHQKYI